MTPDLVSAAAAAPRAAAAAAVAPLQHHADAGDGAAAQRHAVAEAAHRAANDRPERCRRR